MKRFLMLFMAVLLCGCMSTPDKTGADTAARSMQLDYATQFEVGYREDGCAEIHIGDDHFLLVPEGQQPPDTDMTVIQQPVHDIYDAASSSLDLFDGLGRLDDVVLCSTKRDDWKLPAVREAMDSGRLSYAGKYSSPDYERLTNCSLVIESTMIYHTPEVREKIISLGIPVLVERSSYESHPLGRLEWIKLYGLILGIPDEAERYFEEKKKVFTGISSDKPENERPRTAFFYIAPNGYVVIRKPGDYVSEMIRLAGGRYIFDDADLGFDENALSTANIQFEVFYRYASDADILIYNSTVDSDTDTIDEMIAKQPMLAELPAVKNGNVWVTEQNLFQQTTCAAEMISDISSVINGSEEDLTYLKKCG